MGVSLSVDDFGTGYSSMAYLKLLPVCELKVDRSFVRHMAIDHEDALLVQSAIDLGHSLGLSVVAEGVEDGPTLRALQELGADQMQGYYLARPMPQEALQDWMRRRAGAGSHDVPRPTVATGPPA
jgi:EAL domain-containing protein (putative c-di-GMP-specific phosphodiesterase class I)